MEDSVSMMEELIELMTIRQNPNLQDWGNNFMENYYRKNPKASDEDMFKAMYESSQKKCKWRIIRAVVEMMQEYIDVRSQMDNPYDPQDVDIERASKSCLFFNPLHKALQLSHKFLAEIDKYNWKRKEKAGPSTRTTVTTTSAQSAKQEVDKHYDIPTSRRHSRTDFEASFLRYLNRKLLAKH